ncbi:DUF4179 domain-containing protein [Blautia schinkii]|nr:DUF4179 domain-containing protein [Blautia schinkii]
MIKEFDFSKEFGEIDEELIESAGNKWSGQKRYVIQLYERKIACAVMIVALGVALASNSKVQAAVSQLTTKISEMFGFSKDLTSYTEIIDEKQTKNGIPLTVKEVVVDNRVILVLVETDFVKNGKTPALWINYEKTTINGRQYLPSQTFASEGGEAEILNEQKTTTLAVVYDDPILSADRADIHLVIEAGDTVRLPGQKLDSMAEFSYDFTCTAEEIAASTIRQNPNITIPVQVIESGNLSLDEFIMNDLYCQIVASGISPDEEFSERYELKLKGTDSFENPVSLLQGNFRNKNELVFATNFSGDYEFGDIVEEDEFQMSVPDKDCSYVELQLYMRELNWKQETVIQYGGEYYPAMIQEIPSKEDNYGWEPVGERFRIAINRD